MTAQPYEPSEPCSISVDVKRTDDVAELQAAAKAALDEALRTEVGEKFKKGECRELIVLFHSVGP
jgi:hypothetical protein